MAWSSDVALIWHVATALVTCLLLVLASVLSCYYCLVHMRLIQPKVQPCIAKMPLQTLELWLIRALYAGLVGFTVLLGSSFYSFSTTAIDSPLGALKVWLSCALWGLLVMLVMGRRFWGWRGEYTALALVGGAVLLCLVYVFA